jgi:hypothetical protein
MPERLDSITIALNSGAIDDRDRETPAMDVMGEHVQPAAPPSGAVASPTALI